MLRTINDVGPFDISGDIIMLGEKMREAPPKVFLTVIQADGTFKAVDKLQEMQCKKWRKIRLTPNNNAP
ncbi:MAG: hypothetical protein ACLQDM_23065 [Bradyrhizobium sp.]